MVCIKTPESTTRVEKLELKPVLRHYWEIATSSNYMLGVACTIAAAMPLLIWLGLAPNLILHNLHLDYIITLFIRLLPLSLSISSI